MQYPACFWSDQPRRSLCTLAGARLISSANMKLTNTSPGAGSRLLLAAGGRLRTGDAPVGTVLEKAKPVSTAPAAASEEDKDKKDEVKQQEEKK